MDTSEMSLVKLQLLHRLNFYNSLIEDIGHAGIFESLQGRINQISVSEDWYGFNKKPLVDIEGKPFVLDDDTFPLRITGEVEIFGYMGRAKGEPIFIGIAGEALRNALAQDFEAIRSMRFETKTVQIQYEGSPRNIYLTTSGLAFSSLHQPTNSAPSTPTA